VRENLQQVAKKMLTEKVGAEQTVVINPNDGLTGNPPGMPPRGDRAKHVTLRVQEQARKDGKKRAVVVEAKKGTVLAAGEWA
jgi:hypothetical protein